MEVTASGSEAESELGNAFGVWVAHTESDNVFDQSVPLRGDYPSVGILLNANRDARHLELGANVDLAYRRYSVTDLEADERIGTAYLSARVDAVPERFAWSFQEDYGQTLTNPFGANSFGNRESYNIFSTGPELMLPVGQRTFLGLRSTYQDRRYANTGTLDSEQLDHELGVIRNVSSVATFGFILGASTVEYDPEFETPGYDVVTASIRYEKELSSGNVLAELGENEIQTGDLSASGPLATFAWSRSVARRSRVIVSANRNFTDAGALLGAQYGSTNGGDAQDVLLSADPMEIKAVAFRYELAGRRSFVSIGFTAQQENYLTNDTLDNDGHDVQVSFERELTTRLVLRADIGSLRRDFESIGVVRDEMAAIILDRTLGQHLSGSLRIEAVSRNTGPDAFDRLLYEFRLVYSPGRRR